ncbi:glycosyltransferase family 2 protein [Nonlabens marinus]|uniref:Glycosyl transferase family 2 n=1 Tax=Nonlabens marinus S1-08 TaxID=1454201 RepID=W8VWY7_9FLAO|nr:glycosyltransferase family 2 protein [Nonlabens marinus]BAO56733.1 glycosyl transferase family 2 [Nonlabens marinus S1-08]
MHDNLRPLVSCLILNWNRKIETARCIDSVKRQTYNNLEIIIVDNGSDDGSVQFLKDKYPNIPLIELAQNFGCPGGRNRGLEYCNGEYIFHVDNDGVLHEKAIENAIRLITRDDDIAILTGLVMDFDDPEQIVSNLIIDDPKQSITNLFQGGISMHRKSIYDLVSKYPDDYMYGGEETFLSLKLLDFGFKIMKSNQVILWHKKSEFARHNGIETIRKWSNSLVNAYQLYPSLKFLQFFVYYHCVYPFYALRAGYFKLFFKNLFETYSRLRNYSRDPIKTATYYKFKCLEP